MPEIFQNNKDSTKPAVLIAMLDWGMGHTTRSSTIIKHLIELNFNVIVCCNSVQKSILVTEFPFIEYHSLKGYGLSYGSSGWGTRLKLILQVPKILIRINQENRWLRQFIREKKPVLIISDNRYGFFSKKIPSILITHQLCIQTGMGHITNKLIGYINIRFMNRFSRCWVPDSETALNAGGILSHPQIKPSTPVQYLGCLSRFDSCSNLTKTFPDILIILSGPEPQRTILENKVLEQVQSINCQVTLVRGLPGTNVQLAVPAHVTVHNYLPTRSLNELLCSAQFVISRSGYTSIMDYLKLGVSSILIPTPGQAEQEYLANHLSQQGLAIKMSQKDFSIPKCIEIATSFPFKKTSWPMTAYKEVISREVHSLLS